VFGLNLELQARCIKCGIEREPEGKKIASVDATWIIKARTPCECGESRVKVTLDFGEEAPESR
jgi:hypothetical protein